MNEPNPALIEKVTQAIEDADSRWYASGCKGQCFDALAEAAIAAVLPDRAAFERASNDLSASAFNAGIGYASGDGFGQSDTDTTDAKYALYCLVYGDDQS